jgi:SAM-dependent methyltransferase
VRREHFEELKPVCPVCRTGDGTAHALKLAHVETEEKGHIIEGALHCSNNQCQREFPIIDGIPVIVANIRHYLSEQILNVFSRNDLSAYTESILGDCCGPNSAFDQRRQHLSFYAWDHYADLDPDEGQTGTKPGSIKRLLETALQLAGQKGNGIAILPRGKTISPQLDIGCSAGRSTFELARSNGALTLGVDLHFAKLRLAASALRAGRVSYPLRRAGIIYDRRSFPVQFESAAEVDFWACDATALPFESGVFGLVMALNVLDCVSDPRGLLNAISKALAQNGRVVLACPYDWSPNSTAIENWLGGHSQRSSAAGSPEAVLRTLLAGGSEQGVIKELKLVSEKSDVPWHVRLHDRSAMNYNVHVLVAEKV